MYVSKDDRYNKTRADRITDTLIALAHSVESSPTRCVLYRLPTVVIPQMSAFFLLTAFVAAIIVFTVPICWMAVA